LLALDPREPMPDGILPPLARRTLQTPQRERPRGREVAHAMLMMNRERLARFAPGSAVAAPVQEPLPARRRGVIAA